MKTTTVSLTALCLLAQRAAAASAIGSGAGPNDGSTSYATANTHPNATGSVQFPAVDTTHNDTTIRPVKWQAHINVTDVPFTANETVTNSVLSFNAGSDVFAAGNGWSACMLVMTDVFANATKRGQKDTGDCHATFSADCVGNLTRSLTQVLAQEMASSKNASDACSSIGSSYIPSQCAGMVNINSFSTTISPDEIANNKAWKYASSDPHALSNTSYYEAAAQRIWPMVLIQSYNGTAGAAITTANMGCLKAHNATTGSLAIKDVGGAGVKLGSWSSWSILAVVGVMGMVI